MSDEQNVRLRVDHLRVEPISGSGDIVDQVAFELLPGRMLCLVGESGSGKTSVALALLGYVRAGLRIAEGAVMTEGSDVLSLGSRDLRSLRGHRVAYVPQDPARALNPALRIRSQIEEIFTSHSVGRGGARISELLSQVGLDEPVLDSYPHQLSGGQQQRAALAMAFALNPRVIVLDEPTTGLDAVTRTKVFDTIDRLRKASGAATVLVTHDLGVVRKVADDVAVMYAGRIVEYGDAASVLGAPAHPYTQALLEASPSADGRRALVGLPGYPPPPQARPTGCNFASRCRWRQERCVAADPQPVVAKAGQTVRCVRVGEIGQLANERRIGRKRAARGQAPALGIDKVSASYGSKVVLSDVSLEVAKNEFLAVVGESGSGKTTLVRCVVGMHERWSGEITLAGTALARDAKHRSREALRAVQYVFQNPYGSLNPRRTVQEIVEQPLIGLTDLGRREREIAARAALAAAALSDQVRLRYPTELSGGERQRVAIARALAVRPEILVCDEVTSSLDVSVQAAIVGTLTRLQEEQGLTIIFVTHDLALVRTIADRVAVLYDGALVESAPTSELFAKPAAAYTRILLDEATGGANHAASKPTNDSATSPADVTNDLLGAHDAASDSVVGIRPRSTARESDDAS